MVLNGHAHAYERSKPLVAGQPVADGAGPVYIVEGGGGADPYDVSPLAFTAFAQKIYGYVLLDISAQKLTHDRQGSRRHRHRHLLDHEVARLQQQNDRDHHQADVHEATEAIGLEPPIEEPSDDDSHDDRRQ